MFYINLFVLGFALSQIIIILQLICRLNMETHALLVLFQLIHLKKWEDCASRLNRTNKIININYIYLSTNQISLPFIIASVWASYSYRFYSHTNIQIISITSVSSLYILINFFPEKTDKLINETLYW